MPEEVQGAPAVPPPAPDAGVAPSATVAPPAPLEASGQAPPPSSQPEVKPWNLPPEQRWQEILQERDAARQAYQELATRVSQPVVTLPAQPVPDPWEGLLNHPDPATAQFWQTQYKLQQPVLQRVQGLERTVETGTQELAALRVENFRLKNPDITPNSLEEQAIAAYVKAGYPLEVARKAGLFDLHYGQLKSDNDVLRGKAGILPQRVAANASDATSGIPATSGLPRPPVDWRDKARQAYRKGGGLADIVNAAGAAPQA